MEESPAGNSVYTPFVIVTAFVRQKSTYTRTTTMSKPAPINGAYTDR